MLNAATVPSFASAQRPPLRAVRAVPTRQVANPAAACCDCKLRDLCLPCGLSETDFTHVDELVFTRRRVKSGEHLFRAGDDFTSLYAVRSGFFRSSLTRSTGERQVTGFSMAGEVLGLDGIDDDKHTCDTMALEDSEVCIIPFAQLERLSREMPALQRRLHRMMGREIMRDHGIMLLLGSMRAEERMATFLLNLSARFAARGYSATAFHLRMSRDDIGSYLGVKLETVSRMLSRFQHEGLIAVQHKDIEIRNLDGLKAVIGDYETRRSPPSIRHPAAAAAVI